MDTSNIRLILLVLGVFLFICSLEGVKYGFKSAGGEWQGYILSMIKQGIAPLTGLAIGILATALVQSSSAVVATTMVSMAGLVAAGLPFASAISFGIPIVLGAEVGTTVTNGVVAFGVRKKEEFNHAIPGVVIHDILNILNVSLFFVLELTTGLLSKIVITSANFLNSALNLQTVFANFENGIMDIVIKAPIIKPVGDVFTGVFGTQFSGVALIATWFGTLIFALFLIEKNMSKLIKTTRLKQRIMSAFKSTKRSFMTGFFVTWVAGSSSVGTSLAVPLLAKKVIDLKKVYPYVQGCNVGTSLDLSQVYAYIAGGIVGLTLGLVFILVNILGALIWLCTPLRMVPLRIADNLGKLIGSNGKSGMFLLGYISFVFFCLPLAIIFII